MNSISRFQRKDSPTLKLLAERLEALPEEDKLKLEGEGSNSLGAWFLGTKGENIPAFRNLIQKAITAHEDARLAYYPGDPAYVTKEVQNSEEFRESMQMMETELDRLLKQLQNSGPFWSMRSIGHMLWDTAVPGLLGYFAALLYNQNNVAAEASPVTTVLEMEVGNDLCRMLGYKVEPIKPTNDNSKACGIPRGDQITGWGHITCDGSVANTEGLWMGRNLKFYPVAFKAAIEEEPDMQPAKDLMVKLLNGERRLLIRCTNWELLNLPIDEVLNLALKAHLEFGIDMNTISNAVNNRSVQVYGLFEFYQRYLPDIKQGPVSFAPTTKHYSWPKAASLLGMGSGSNISILVDEKARMRPDMLEAELQKCLERQTPVTTVIAVIGTTEESAVDPLKDILEIREEFRQKGMEFTVHADAAWGGYFAAMLREKDHNAPQDADEESFVPSLPMSDYVVTQYKQLYRTDSITIDPHKAGYVPYPAGGLCYRNSAMRNMVSFTAPVVYHGGIDPTVGVYGVEGSKPGAAAAAVYLAHRVIRPNSRGYGQILGECYFTAKKFYANLQCLNLDEDKPFIAVPLAELPAVQQGGSILDGIKQIEFMRERIIDASNEELLNDPKAMSLVKEMGQDQTIITYMFNFKYQDGSLNTDTKMAAKLNNELYQRLSFKPYEEHSEQTPLVVTSSNFSEANYGKAFMTQIRTRLGVLGDEEQPIDFIISTVMNPWLTATDNGSFLPKFMDILSQTLTDIIHDIWAGKITADS